MNKYEGNITTNSNIDSTLRVLSVDEFCDLSLPQPKEILSQYLCFMLLIIVYLSQTTARIKSTYDQYF